MKPFFSFVISLWFSFSLLAQPVTETWPMIHGNPAHTSSAHINITFPLMLANDFPLLSNREAGTAISEDKIFFSCYGDPNTLYCVDLFTGDSLWSFEVPNSGGGNQFAPAVAHGVVLSGGQQGRGLYGLDVHTGEVLWLDTIGSLYDRRPVVYDSMVYIASHEGLRCLEIATGKLLWRSENGTPQFSPGVDSLYVYFNSYGTGGGEIYAKDRLTGETVWSTESVATGHSTSYILDDSLLYYGYEDTITAFNKMTGDILWQTALDTNELIYYSGMAALSDSFLVTKTRIGEEDFNHYRVIEKATGLIRNRYNGGPWVWSVPSLINNYLVECGYNQIRFLDIMTGDSLYGLNNLTFGNSPSQPVAANDRIVLIGDAGHINILQSSPSGTKIIEPDFGVALFPNPANTNVRLDLDLLTTIGIDISIVSQNGVVVYHEKPDYLKAGKHSLNLPLKNIPGGIYFIQVRSEKGVVTKKLIVE